MFKLFSIIAMLLFVNTIHAQTLSERWREGTDTIRILAGGAAGATNLGVDYEHRMGPWGVGAFVLFGDDYTSDHYERPEQWIVGIGIPFHLIDQTNWDVYVAPGLNAIMYNDVVTNTATNEKTDETTFGPNVRVGATYFFNNNWSAGLDYLMTTNWFNNKVAQDRNYAHAVVGYTF